MQSPRHPRTIWVRGCPWSALFSQVFDLFSHPSGTGKENSPFSPSCLLSIAPQACSSFKCLLHSQQRLKVTSAVCSWGPRGRRHSPLHSSLSHTSKSMRPEPSSNTVLDVKRQWLATKLMVSLPSKILTAILHCWKCSYADFYSNHLCFWSMPSTKIKYHALCLTLFPFSSGTFTYFMSLVWSQVLPFSYSSNRQTGI